MILPLYDTAFLTRKAWTASEYHIIAAVITKYEIKIYYSKSFASTTSQATNRRKIYEIEKSKLQMISLWPIPWCYVYLAYRA